MIKVIKDLFKKADKLKRDSDGHVIANRQGGNLMSHLIAFPLHLGLILNMR